MTRTVAALAALAMVAPSVVMAQQRVTAVRDLLGWKCMAPRAAYEMQGAFAPPVPIYAAPESTARVVGVLRAVVLVSKTTRPINGRVDILTADGSKAWVNVSQLIPWRSVTSPSGTCHPAALSDGTYGARITG